MTTFSIPRGQARALWASLLSHAGKQSEDTPEYGRVRFMPGASELLGWTVDGVTAVASWVDVIDHADADLEPFDLSTSALKAALAVFRGPADKDARQMWDDQDLAVDVQADTVVLTEVGGIVEGRSLTLERIVVTDDDRYPDVPRLLAHPVEAPPADTARVSADALARFIPSAKAWDGDLTLAVTGRRVDVHIGRRLYGLLPIVRLQSPDGEPEHEPAADHGPWAARLAPHVRPVKDPGADVKVALHVVRDGGAS